MIKRVYRTILILAIVGTLVIGFGFQDAKAELTVIDSPTTIEDLEVGKNDMLIVNADITITGKLENSGIIFVNVVTITVNEGGVIENIHIINLNSGVLIIVGTLHNSGTISTTEAGNITLLGVIQNNGLIILGEGIDLDNDSGLFDNRKKGTLVLASNNSFQNRATIVNSGFIIFFGTSSIQNADTIINKGEISFFGIGSSDGFLENQLNAVVNNFGKINNFGFIQNDGVMNNCKKGLVINIGDFFGNPINENSQLCTD